MLDIACSSSRIVSLTSLPASSLSSSALAAAFSSTPSISTSSPSAVDGPASAVSGSSSSPSSAPYVPSSSGRASASGCSGGNSGGAVASESLDRRQQLLWQCLRENRIPFDSKSGYSWFLSEDIAADLLDDGLARWFRGQLLVLVLVVHIVSYAYKLASIVAAREKNDGDA